MILLCLYRIIRSEAVYLLCLFLPYDEQVRAGARGGKLCAVRLSLFVLLFHCSAASRPELVTTQCKNNIFRLGNQNAECETRLLKKNLNASKSSGHPLFLFSCLCSPCSHLTILTCFPPVRGMLRRRFRCVRTFL